MNTPNPTPSQDPNRFGPEITLLGALLCNPRCLAEHPEYKKLTSAHFSNESRRQLFNLFKYDPAFTAGPNRRASIMRNHPFFSANIPNPQGFLDHYMAQSGPPEPALKIVLQAFEDRNESLPGKETSRHVPSPTPGKDASHRVPDISPGSSPGKDAFHRVPDISPQVTSDSHTPLSTAPAPKPAISISESADTDTAIANRFHQTSIRLLKDPSAKLAELKAAVTLSLKFRQASLNSWKSSARQARRLKRTIENWNSGSLSTEIAATLRTRLLELTDKPALDFKECKVLSDLLIKLQTQEHRESDAVCLFAAQTSKSTDQEGRGMEPPPGSNQQTIMPVPGTTSIAEPPNPVAEPRRASTPSLAVGTQSLATLADPSLNLAGPHLLEAQPMASAA